MSELAARLAWCQQAGLMTVSDLAHWLDRPNATVRTWLFMGRVPRTSAQRVDVDNKLRLLELAITHKCGFPLSPTESQRTRPQTIERIRDELERSSVPARHPA